MSWLERCGSGGQCSGLASGGIITLWYIKRRRALLARTGPEASLQENLQVRPDRPRHPRMDDVVRPRHRFVAQARDVVVLDIVPFHIEQIEGIDRYQPVTGALGAERQIETRVRRRLRTVVFHEGRCTEVPGPQAAKPTGGELRRNAAVDHRSRAVRDIAAGYGDRLGDR